jgi:AbrB family looped-hinge helix DNA binding protein
VNQTVFFKTRMRAKGQVTIPGEVRELLNVKEGDDLVFRTSEEGHVIVESAKIIPPGQAWFWTERWQRMEREAQADIEAGRTTHYENVEKAISDLEALEDAEGRTD